MTSVECLTSFRNRDWVCSTVCSAEYFETACSEEKFQTACEIRMENNPEDDIDDGDMEEVGDVLDKHIKKYGPLYTLIDALTKIRPICGGCDATMEWDGTKTGQSLGITVPKFGCTNCENTRNIPSKEAMQSMHDCLPLRCPYCINVERFDCEQIREAGSQFDYRYECGVCGHGWGSNMHPDEIKRILDHPELTFSINDDSLDPDLPDEDDNGQQNLDNFNQ